MQKNSFLNKKGTTKLVVLSFFFLFLISFISAVKPTQSGSFTEGYELRIPQIETLKLGQDFTINTHIYNVSNGVLITNKTASCVAHLYNDVGKHQSTNGMNYNVDKEEFSLFVTSGNFSSLGIVTYLIQCNSSEISGFVSGSFEVTPSGKSGNSNIVFFIFIILIIYGITFTGLFGKNIPITILGGMAMMFLGIYTIQNGIIIYRDVLTLYFSYVTISLGIICASWAILEQFDLL